MAISTTGAAHAGAPRPAQRPAGRVGSEEYHSAPLPPAQEAAVLYAANLVAPAEAILKGLTRDPASRTNKQPWLMLFDLFELTQNRTEYEALSLLYTVRFEQSPPAWAGGTEVASDPRRAQSRERKDFFALKPNAMGELGPEIEKLVTFAEQMGTVRIDFGKVASITAAEAALLAAALQRLRRAGLPMWFNNADSLELVLRATFNEPPSDAVRSFWLLLFELYVLQGRSEPFEELGLEYAVAFEMSPPNWAVYVNTVAESAARVPAAPAAPEAPAAGFSLKGVVSTASQNQFADLAAHAASGTEIVVDMGKVLRVDFAAGAQFFEVVKAIQLAGKRVILSNLSELNAALLEAFGFNRHAILIRRKAN
ncbi:MAG TPA: STAS domain-containing protein [Usitatibacteraceae bacterium]|nr:STAS domain-containing protein [Usitatibacteraceae bacterium]HQY46166.1 STAS domain-containing protein [Usitatibacteraceae bacterium]